MGLRLRIIAVVFMVLVLSYVFVMSVYVFVYLFIPDTREYYEFTKYGLYGKGPDEILEVVESTNDLNAVLAGIDALHFASEKRATDIEFRKKLRSAFLAIWARCDSTWVDKPRPSDLRYQNGASSYNRHGLKQTWGDVVAAVWLVEYARFARFDYEPIYDAPLGKYPMLDFLKECRAFYQTIEPDTGTALHEIWTENHPDAIRWKSKK